MYAARPSYPPQARVFHNAIVRTPRGVPQHASTGGTMDDMKAFMDKTTMGVANKYLIGGAAVIGLGYYGYTKGWF